MHNKQTILAATVYRIWYGGSEKKLYLFMHDNWHKKFACKIRTIFRAYFIISYSFVLQELHMSVMDSHTTDNPIVWPIVYFV